MSTSSKFNFKSSGQKAGNRLTKRKISTNVNFGIKTPVTNLDGHSMFDIHTDIKSQLKDNLKNLIMTNHGERLGLVDYGADLYPVLFDLTSTEGLEQEITNRIMLAIDKWMSVITVDDIQILEMDRTEKTLINTKSMTKIKLRVIFSLPQLGFNNMAVDIALIPGG
jgi:phage baseplate assembly protein W